MSGFKATKLYFLFYHIKISLFSQGLIFFYFDVKLANVIF